MVLKYRTVATEIDIKYSFFEHENWYILGYQKFLKKKLKILKKYVDKI